jgi:hypothetical protein
MSLTAATNGPIVSPSDDIFSMESDAGIILTGENRRETCTSVTLSTTHLTWTDTGENTDLCGHLRCIIHFVRMASPLDS